MSPESQEPGKSTESAQSKVQEASTTTDLARERTELARHRTAMSSDRTHWANDRTLIAWIRTSLSLIGFGFGIGRALEYLQELGRDPDRYYTAKIFGGGFIVLGVLGLLAAILQHVKIEHRFRKSGYPRVEPWPLGLVVASLLLLMGIYGFVVVILNPR
jgi:uncharacterized membrane protein YidH (DUF202 family)